MLSAYTHLLLNHVPILGTFFGLAALFYGVARRSDEVLRLAWLTWLVAGLVALPVYFSGEPAEEAVEGRPEVSKMLVERHEDAARNALAAALACAAVAAGALFASRGGRRPARGLIVASAVLGLVTSALMGLAGSLGGQIRHSEIRPGAQPAQPYGDERPSHDDDI